MTWGCCPACNQSFLNETVANKHITTCKVLKRLREEVEVDPTTKVAREWKEAKTLPALYQAASDPVKETFDDLCRRELARRLRQNASACACPESTPKR